jgi:N-acetyl-anhydromuramyl-L-alanine amidase AmpD
MSSEEILKVISKPCNRNITDLIVHCTATRPGAAMNVDVLDRMHAQRGFKKQPISKRICGYHFVILESGEIQTGRDLNETGAHVEGQNSRSIGIAYAGGIDAAGKEKDTRTPEQMASLEWLLSNLKTKFPNAKIGGHRDYSPDLNGDGIIEKWEWVKECPCFDVIPEYANLNY